MTNETISPGKANPADLTLRAAPAPVTRFNRRILVALLGIAGIAVFAALFYSLGLHHGGKPATTELYGANQPVTDRLNALPSTYSDIPQPKRRRPHHLRSASRCRAISVVRCWRCSNRAPVPHDRGPTIRPPVKPTRPGSRRCFFAMPGSAGFVSATAPATTAVAPTDLRRRRRIDSAAA